MVFIIVPASSEFDREYTSQVHFNKTLLTLSNTTSLDAPHILRSLNGPYTSKLIICLAAPTRMFTRTNVPIYPTRLSYTSTLTAVRPSKLGLSGQKFGCGLSCCSPWACVTLNRCKGFCFVGFEFKHEVTLKLRIS